MTVRLVVIAALSCITVPSISGAQLVATPSPRPTSACADRPSEPLIIQNMDAREANRVLFLRDMYRAYTFNGIVESGTCSCEQRYPSWEPVVEYYLEHYAIIEDRHELREYGKPYQNTINEHRTIARDICLASGTWN